MTDTTVPVPRCTYCGALCDPTDAFCDPTCARQWHESQDELERESEVMGVDPPDDPDEPRKYDPEETEL